MSQHHRSGDLRLNLLKQSQHRGRSTGSNDPLLYAGAVQFRKTLDTGAQPHALGARVQVMHPFAITHLRELIWLSSTPQSHRKLDAAETRGSPAVC